MCGFAGIVGQIGEPNRAALNRMNTALVHRGPDGEGFWEASPDEDGWGAMFAHRRLSILDLSTQASQPMVDPVTGQVVVLNGEIYNYVELRSELDAAGQSLRSTGDTAVMLRTVSMHGRQAISRLRGMFAFALWDQSQRKLLLARDALGIKPLYIACNTNPGAQWSLAFASEVRAILASGLLGAQRLNPLAASSVVWNGFMVAPETAITGIESVLPGQLRVYGSKGEEEISEFYWNASRKPGGSTIDEPTLALELEKSVHRHLASDVPLSVFLSGGVDSSAIANLAQKNSEDPINTFTLAFEEAEYNEGPAARDIAAAIGTRHKELVLTEQAFVSQLDAALDSLDQPTFDGLNSYYMSHAVREAGFKVALVGTGGDELFGGYSSFSDLPRLHRWCKRANWMPAGVRASLAKFVAGFMLPESGSIPPQTRWAKLPDMVQRGDELLSLYQMAYSLFLPKFQKQLLRNDVKDAFADGLPPAMRDRLLLEAKGRSPLSSISVFEQRLFLGERLLRDTDAASMSASIEVRLPFVDQGLFDTVDRVPDDDRYHPIKRKSLLRRIGLRGLDPALFDRPKSGFVLPFDRWLRSDLGRLMDQMLRDPEAVRPTGLNPDAVRKLWQAFLENAPGIYWSRIWAIYAFIRWCHVHSAYL